MTPKTQEILLGHQKIEADILAQLNNKRHHHAYILSGAAGLGKATFAFRVAKYILARSTDPTTLHVDPDLPVVRRIISGGHGDLCYIEPDPTKDTAIISVDQIRAMSQFFGKHSMEGGYRIAIIDGHLNRNAANALLKILEEPPKDVIIFLITSFLGKLLPTIRSRCQSVKFSPLSADETAKALDYLDTPVNREVVAASMGSPGKALWLLQNGGIETYSGFLSAIGEALKDNLQAINEFALAHVSKPKDGSDPFPAIGQMFLDIIYRHTNAGSEATDKEIAVFAAMAKTKSFSQWAETWQEINLLFKQAIESHLDKYQILLTSFTKFSSKYKGN